MARSIWILTFLLALAMVMNTVDSIPFKPGNGESFFLIMCELFVKYCKNIIEHVKMGRPSKS